MTPTFVTLQGMPIVALVCFLLPVLPIAAGADGLATGQPVGAIIQPPPGTATPAPDDLAGYQASVAALQAQYGAHDARVGEAMVGLGLAHRAAGEYARALAAFREALQLSRVNEGLHHPRQLDLLERVIEAQAALEDWDGLDDSFHYLHWIALRNFLSGDPRLVLILDRVARWHIQALGLVTKTPGYMHLQQARELYMQAVAAAERIWGPNDRRLMGTLINAAAVNLELALAVDAQIDVVQREYFETEHNEQFDSERMRLMQIALVAYRDGEALMRRVVAMHEADPSLSARSHARARLLLGDWYLLNGKRNQAEDSYRRAHDVFQASGAGTDEMQAMFGSPRQLPAWELAPAVALPGPAPTATRVVVNYEVNERGRARAIEVLETESARDGTLQRSAKELLESTRFRPRLEAGAPVAASDLRKEYVFPNP